MVGCRGRSRKIISESSVRHKCQTRRSWVGSQHTIFPTHVSIFDPWPYLGHIEEISDNGARLGSRWQGGTSVIVPLDRVQNCECEQEDAQRCSKIRHGDPLNVGMSRRHQRTRQGHSLYTYTHANDRTGSRSGKLLLVHLFLMESDGAWEAVSHDHESQWLQHT